MKIRRLCRKFEEARHRVEQRTPLRLYVPECLTAECSICQLEFEAVCDDQGSILALSDLDQRHIEEYADTRSNRLSDKFLVSFPCKNPGHVACVGCYRKLLKLHGCSNFTCKYPYSTCPSKSQCSTEDSSLVLSQGEFRYHLVGDEVRCCNNQVVFGPKSHGIGTCRTCWRRFCVGCKRLLKHDMACICGYPSWDRYYRDLLTGHLQAKTDISPSDRAKLVAQISSCEVPSVVCPDCGAVIHKVTDCNCISHCGYQICWICNYAADVIPIDHWKTCPRYDHDMPDYPCRQGVCYDFYTECKNPDHAPGRKTFHEFRRSKMIRSLQSSE